MNGKTQQPGSLFREGDHAGTPYSPSNLHSPHSLARLLSIDRVWNFPDKRHSDRYASELWLSSVTCHIHGGQTDILTGVSRRERRAQHCAVTLLRLGLVDP